MDNADVCRLAIDFISSSDRWSKEREPCGRRTLLYGMICQSFVLLDQLLRASTKELIAVSKIAEMKVLKNAPRGVATATMGQCISILRDCSPEIEYAVHSILASLGKPVRLLPHMDEKSWSRIIKWRNALLHNGPGYIDSADMYAGRSHFFSPSEKLSEKNRADMSKTVWTEGEILCQSRAIVTAAVLQGAKIDSFRAQMARARLQDYALPLGKTLIKTIDEFHENGPTS
jgi:hypothetical protein